MIHLKGIHYRYPASDWILKGIDLTIMPGDYLVVLGGNGSGKSTLGYLINGFIPDFFGGTFEGSLIWDDLAHQNGDSVHRFSRVGLVLQNTDAQLFHSTVSDEMAFGLENLGLPDAEIEERIQATAALLGLDHLLTHAPSQLSGGEKRLAAIAAVLCLNPALLILDEPFANLDWQGCRRVQNMLGNIHHSGTIVVVIEQRLGPFLQDATRCCILQQGRVLFEGPPTPAPEMLSKEHLRPHYPRRSTLGPSAEEVMLEVRDLSYQVGRQEILCNISFDIKKGESIAIIGKNGAGKTTLIKHFNSLLRPSSGEIYFQGKAIFRQPPARMAAKVGLSFQNPNDQFFKSRVKEELLVGPQMLGKADAGWIDHISAVFDLEGLLKRSPYRLSEGEKKRVALCAIFSMQSDLVVLDEPTAGQDGRFREALAGFLTVLEDLGFTILIVTHDLDFAKATTDRWIVLDKGRMVADGSPDDICGDYRLAEAGITESIQN